MPGKAMVTAHHDDGKHLHLQHRDKKAWPAASAKAARMAHLDIGSRDCARDGTSINKACLLMSEAYHEMPCRLMISDNVTRVYHICARPPLKPTRKVMPKQAMAREKMCSKSKPPTARKYRHHYFIFHIKHSAAATYAIYESIILLASEPANHGSS